MSAVAPQLAVILRQACLHDRGRAEEPSPHRAKLRLPRLTTS